MLVANRKGNIFPVLGGSTPKARSRARVRGRRWTYTLVHLSENYWANRSAIRHTTTTTGRCLRRSSLGSRAHGALALQCDNSLSAGAIDSRVPVLQRRTGGVSYTRDTKRDRTLPVQRCPRPMAMGWEMLSRAITASGACSRGPYSIGPSVIGALHGATAVPHMGGRAVQIRLGVIACV